MARRTVEPKLAEVGAGIAVAVVAGVAWLFRGRHPVRRPVEPMIAVLDAAPLDDEALTPEDEAAIRDSERARAAGEQFLTMAEIESDHV